MNSKNITLLLADDDPDDCLLIQEAFNEKTSDIDLRMVSNGEQLIDYLNHCGEFKDPANSPSPSLILLDLNMPRKDGREALIEIKKSLDFKKIPVVVLTTSNRQEDIIFSYDFGANSFIIKPHRFEELLNLVTILNNYWFHTVQLPN